MSAGQPGTRLRCPKCGKLLCVAYVPAGGWVEMACRPCKALIVFEPGRDPIIMPRHGQPEATP